MEHSLTDLEAFARQFDTDKQAGQNEYLALYLEYFKSHGFKRDAPLRILEIGTNKGSSLRMWAEYFPNAEVFGFDITRRYEIPEVVTHPRVSTHLVDAGDPIAVEDECNNIGAFDIIIDDGSHDQKDMQVAWGVLFHYLMSGGLYVIEDIITGENWWDGNLYNKSKVTPTRNIIKQIEAGIPITKVDVIPEDEWDYIEKTMSYCEYRESPAIIYERHHPQMAFIGKKNG
tara:strand:+ start:2427 stop:3113 length:687 start_codon:yes stop_codon:yes gene_type:complete